MATSTGVLEAIAVKGMSKFPVLPPIEGTLQQRDDVGQIIAAKEEIAEKIKVPGELLRHKRSQVQQDQLQMRLYVFSQFCSFVTTSVTATSIEE